MIAEEGIQGEEEVEAELLKEKGIEEVEVQRKKEEVKVMELELEEKKLKRNLDRKEREELLIQIDCFGIFSRLCL